MGLVCSVEDRSTRIAWRCFQTQRYAFAVRVPVYRDMPAGDRRLQKGHFHHGDGRLSGRKNTESGRVLAHISKVLRLFLFSVNSVSQWQSTFFSGLVDQKEG